MSFLNLSHVLPICCETIGHGHLFILPIRKIQEKLLRHTHCVAIPEAKHIFLIDLTCSACSRHNAVFSLQHVKIECM